MSVRVLQHDLDYDVVPQAIIWRPLRYFTSVFREGKDGLDHYIGASFAIGNDIQFALRSYRGHPGLTITLYLPHDVEDESRISEIIDTVISEMLIPQSAVAWRRGQPFEYGRLERPKDDRLREPEARILVLKIAATKTNRSASTTTLKREVPEYTELSPKDLVRSNSRPREALWHQIIGNVISHNKSKMGPFVRGFITKNKDTITVTNEGLRYLSSIGFLEFSPSDFDE